MLITETMKVKGVIGDGVNDVPAGLQVRFLTQQPWPRSSSCFETAGWQYGIRLGCSNRSGGCLLDR